MVNGLIFCCSVAYTVQQECDHIEPSIARREARCECSKSWQGPEPPPSWSSAPPLLASLLPFLPCLPQSASSSTPSSPPFEASHWLPGRRSFPSRSATPPCLPPPPHSPGSVASLPGHKASSKDKTWEIVKMFLFSTDVVTLRRIIGSKNHFYG